MLKIITHPTVEPVTLAEVKEQTNLGTMSLTSEQQSMLELDIQAAREEAELITGRSLAEQTLEVVLDSFPSGNIYLPGGPVAELLSVKYLDADDAEQTMSAGDYDIDTDSRLARLAPVDSWPSTSTKMNSVRVRYTAGWAQEDCPASIKKWILVRCATLFAQREGIAVGFGSTSVAEMPRSFVDGLLDRYTVRMVL